MYESELDGMENKNGKTTATTKLTIEWYRERECEKMVMIWYAVYDGNTFNRPSEHIAFRSIAYTIYTN